MSFFKDEKAPKYKKLQIYSHLPDDITDYSGIIKLGLILDDITTPGRPLFPNAIPEEKLHNPPTDVPLKDLYKKEVVGKSGKIGIWAKVVEKFSFGPNLFHSRNGSSDNTFDHKDVTVKSFNPSSSFLDSLVNEEVVKNYLTDQTKPSHIYLITGLAFSNNSEYTSKGSQESNTELGVTADIPSVASLGVGGDYKGNVQTELSMKKPNNALIAFSAWKIGRDDKGNPRSGRVLGNFFSADDAPPAAAQTRSLIPFQLLAPDDTDLGGATLIETVDELDDDTPCYILTRPDKEDPSPSD